MLIARGKGIIGDSFGVGVGLEGDMDSGSGAE